MANFKTLTQLRLSATLSRRFVLASSVACLINLLIATYTAVAASDWVAIPGGEFVMGDPTGDTNESPVTRQVDSFEIMRHEVTNDEFAAFVAATGYQVETNRNRKTYVWTTRWRQDVTASWLTPHGQGSSIQTKGQHPVVQVSAHDAETFCMFHGARLPSEVEWEYAARGTDQRRYPWGNTFPDHRQHKPLVNFGTVSCCAPSDADGFNTSAPVGHYPQGASPFGVLDMAGNVWEWTSSVFASVSGERVIRGGGWGNNPYCLRVSYKHGNPPDIGLNMVGFRCARASRSN